MWFERHEDEEARVHAHAARAENFHRAGGWWLALLGLSLAVFIGWALWFHIDEVARAQGEVIASSRVQVIQSVDGGVISELKVREGDRVEPGQLLARLDTTRVGATVGEVDARLFALRAKTTRLRAEVTGTELAFPAALNQAAREQVALERALFEQRKVGLQEDLRTLQVALDLARKRLRLVEQLLQSGDASGTELLNAQTAENDAEARVVNRRNKFLEDARIELAKAEDDIAQNQQVLMRRRHEQHDAVFTAQVKGVVKNVRVTTVGGVLRAGEELMQIVPLEDDLVIEAKVMPADIGRVRAGMPASIRFDPFDYTIFGSVQGKVVYVSADTLKEDTARGKDIYYRVHVSPSELPVVTNIGRRLDILPGMTAQVDIRTGERTVMDYLLKPVRKTITESFGER